MPNFPVAQVAHNVEVAIAQAQAHVHQMIYANAHGYTSAQVLAALGNKAAHVTDMLTAAGLVASTHLSGA